MDSDLNYRVSWNSVSDRIALFSDGIQLEVVRVFRDATLWLLRVGFL